ncbi:glycoside hydrolase family 66 protein [Haloplasma contractile]|uniref:Cycloisomaltooligosaccharide glucanotransferase protein n=1 Tax=Haloplasma contractile SSD-17B TaxID=1033810 RepID=U2FJT2_9MOLU|nr:glycoside hydrolase family 66 protein [Haloplasma contractile]ERJ13075.1 Cycloisomaltooligosaccharide glucanotransferase protein [Haloplasma contractile SSD-17B]
MSLKWLLITIALMPMLLLIGCKAMPEETTEAEEVVRMNLFSDLYTDKSRYEPSEQVEIYVNLHNRTEETHSGTVTITLNYLNETVVVLDGQDVTLEEGGRDRLTFELDAPDNDFTGYIIESTFVKEGKEIDFYSSALDVSSDWSKFPRYGYLVEYNKKSRTVIEQTLNNLNKYHINGLQFYDWHYKHELPLPLDENGNPLETWKELSNRDVYLDTVQGYIDVAHEHNMMAMNYNLLFGTFENPEQEGVNLDWGLYTDSFATNIDNHDLTGLNWQTDKILLMDPNNTEWQNHIIEQEKIAMEKLNFDGWHVDQLGGRGDRYDYQGNRVDLVQGYVDLLNKAKTETDKKLVFNAVDGYGQERIAKDIPVDFLYEEVWTFNRSHATYSHLKDVIDHGFEWGNMSTILAAYMNYGNRGLFNTHSILLTNATIFASGGAHLELGDSGMLGSEYFPNNDLSMSNELKSRLRKYYDFLVGYQNLLRDNVSEERGKVEFENNEIYASTNGVKNSVWYFSKTKNHYQMLHLINLLGNENDWRDDEKDKKAPEILENEKINYYIEGDIKNVMLASPDQNEALPIDLEFEVHTDEDGNQFVSLTLPKLEYWDMIIFEK